METRLPEGRPWLGIPKSKRPARKACEYYPPYPMAGADCGWRHQQKGCRQISGNALAPAFFRLMVHQSQGGWRGRIADQDCAAAVRTLQHSHDVGRLWGTYFRAAMT